MATAEPRKSSERRLQGRREQVFVVSKVYPHNASRRGAVARMQAQPEAPRDGSPRPLPICIGAATYRSRKRSTHSESCAAMAASASGGFKLRPRRHGGIVRAAGRSALCRQSGDVSPRLPWRRMGPASPFCRKHQVAVMAYSPVGRGRLLRDRRLNALAGELGVSTAPNRIGVVARTSRRERDSKSRKRSPRPRQPVPPPTCACPLRC